MSPHGYAAHGERELARRTGTRGTSMHRHGSHLLRTATVAVALLGFFGQVTPALAKHLRALPLVLAGQNLPDS